MYLASRSGRFTLGELALATVDSVWFCFTDVFTELVRHHLLTV